MLIQSLWRNESAAHHLHEWIGTFEKHQRRFVWARRKERSDVSTRSKFEATTFSNHDERAKAMCKAYKVWAPCRFWRFIGPSPTFRDHGGYLSFVGVFKSSSKLESHNHMRCYSICKHLAFVDHRYFDFSILHPSKNRFPNQLKDACHFYKSKPFYATILHPQIHCQICYQTYFNGLEHAQNCIVDHQQHSSS